MCKVKKTFLSEKNITYYRIRKKAKYTHTVGICIGIRIRKGGYSNRMLNGHIKRVCTINMSSFSLSPLHTHDIRLLLYANSGTGPAIWSGNRGGGWPPLNCSLFSNNIDKWIFCIFFLFYSSLFLC